MMLLYNCDLAMLTFYRTVQQFLTFLSVLFCHASPAVWNTGSLPQTVISVLTVTTGTFNKRHMTF